MLKRLSEERIKEVAHTASKEGRLSWLGYEQDEMGFYTVPSLSPGHYQLVHAACAALAEANGAVVEGQP